MKDHVRVLSLETLDDTVHNRIPRTWERQSDMTTIYRGIVQAESALHMSHMYVCRITS